MSGSQARSLIAPLNGFRGAQAARGQSVKNHAAENRRALKEMQRKNMEKEAIEKQKTSRGLSKMKQFQGVQSKINNGINANALRDEYEEEEEMVRLRLGRMQRTSATTLEMRGKKSINLLVDDTSLSLSLFVAH